ncbi:DUF6879 family protein [Nocardia alni]|uniref:DUF6879 family protein n=1 Tax=Nocardia alni TaxID=2815723 RepID=UPI001C2207B9|nr:DUF6879 family protein [Nocardia alni]
MHDLLAGRPSEFLAADDMHVDYNKRFTAPGGRDSWKLERLQHFRDPQFVSWEAFDRGEWGRSLRLLEDERASLAEQQGEAVAMGVDLYRVRVVAEPIAPYVQWELHLLALRAQYGERIRVIGPEIVAPFESAEIVPELLTVGTDTVYEFRYDETGTLIGANRYIDTEIYDRCMEFMRSLYAEGEDVRAFFQRRVVGLAPPGAA